jgi:hypothetical protein
MRQKGSLTLSKVELQFRGKNDDISEQAVRLLKKLNRARCWFLKLLLDVDLYDAYFIAPAPSLQCHHLVDTLLIPSLVDSPKAENVNK